MLVDSPQSNNIDRLPDHLFELTAFDNCFVRDKYGKSVRIQDIRKNHICIFVLVRHFLDYTTKEYVEDFSKIFPRDLEDYGVKIVVIGCAPSRFIQPFCDETNFSHEMYCDSKKIIHNTLGFHTYPSSTFGGDSPHVKSNFLSGFFLTMWRYIKSTIEQGDPLQQGGQLILNKDGKIMYFHRDTHSLDHTPINDLLEIAGLPRIDFKLKPYQVEEI